MSRVAVLKVADYQEKSVKEAVSRGLMLLGLSENFFKEKNVLLKPNFLAPSPIERAVCSHPVVIGETAALILEMGGIVKVGDSPGLGSVFKVAGSCGADRVLENLQVPLVSFENPVEVKYPEGRLCINFPLARPVVETDILVSIARLKTHSLTRYTGAVKNLYGCIPGKDKAALHLRYNKIENFSRMLADLLGLIKPALSIVDAVVSMEGPGPRSGNPRKTGFMVMSEDAVAADVTACRLVGIDPEQVLHLKYAGEMGRGSNLINQLDLVGDPLSEIKVKGFKQASGSITSTGFMPPFVAGFLRKCFVPKLQIIPEKCCGCGVCAERCPAEVISMGKKAYIKQDGCIQCYCCQELCPHEAVELKRRFRVLK
ncbi:DUF362 domain-containing protein [Candidatus Contubernalis alkaliaceticus]|uniref:DUF362 domain-containing protein n=1 Tax=Candidatus Contubernalis alkaliaceticus TaxID=338645 RepID=UPI001F4C3FB0|nr:DUF362 domain-containing protein [Candidatus Contubernalis alkalaceticus]UNC92696.1 DUF362 domain-containing protein [Candidatus Contubernalis alkalaceticus]